MIQSIEHPAVEYFDVPVHTADARSVNDSFLVEDSTNIDYDHCVVMTPTKQVTGKRKLVVFFHGAGEPVNQDSWIGIDKFMPQFFAKWSRKYAENGTATGMKFMSMEKVRAEWAH